MWVLQGPSVSYIDGIESTQSLSVRTGHLGPNPRLLFRGRQGAARATLGHAELESIYAGGLTPWRLSRITSLQIAQAAPGDRAAKRLRPKSRRSPQGIAGIGVCVKDPGGHAVAGISVAIPSIRFSRKKIPDYVEALRAAVVTAELSRASIPGNPSPRPETGQPTLMAPPLQRLSIAETF